jgi:hypothetical protein
MMICCLAVGSTLLVVNWVGWQNLTVAARLIVLVELFLVACLVLFLVLGERFAEWAGYGSLWANDTPPRTSAREEDALNRNWSRTAQLKQYLRRTYQEVRCQHSSGLSSEWRRSRPVVAFAAPVPPPQLPPRRQTQVDVSGAAPKVTTPRSTETREQAAANLPAGSDSQPFVTSAAQESTEPPVGSQSPRTCRPSSRLEIRRRQ